jgi:hypothetical protein
MEKLKKDLEVARREKSSALRRLDSLAMECVALQGALEEADAKRSMPKFYFLDSISQNSENESPITLRLLI